MKTKTKIVEFKFDGVFESTSPEGINRSYQLFFLIKKLDDKKKVDFNLSDEEANKFFDIDKNWKILECNVKLCKSLFENSSRYKINIILVDKNNDKIEFKLQRVLMRNNYKFFYKNTFYICFTLESLKKKFKEIQEEHEYFIVATKEGKNITIQPSLFFFMDIVEFQIKINYKFIDIELEKLEFKKIYELPEKISGNKLNEKLGLYTQLKKNHFNDFTYYQTKERKKFLDNLLEICYNNNTNNNIGICGPFGTGKTITLLKFLIESSLNRTFYINLFVIAHTSIEHLKNLFKYESIKLFGGNIFKQDDNFCINEDRHVYLAIVNEIDKFNEKKDIFYLLENIIIFLNKVKLKNDTFIIIDQYSSKYDDKNILLNHLLDIKKNDNIYIVVSSSMNNYDIKKHFSASLNIDKIFLNKSIEDLRFNYYYIGCLIRLNQVDDYEDLIKDESNEFIKYLNELGNIPIFYYQLKDAKTNYTKLSYYMEEEKDKIIGEIDLFYKNNYKSDNIVKFLDILKILSNIDEKEIYFIEALSNEIIKLPLKFIEIKKEEIKLSDLKIYAFASNNQKLLEKLDKMNEEQLQELLLIDSFSKNVIQCFNEDNYCSKYIDKISEKKRKRILGKEKYNDSKINIYYLDYLFPYMKEIFSEMIYNVLINTSKFIYSYLPPQSQGGLLEYIINTFVKSHKEFMSVLILDFETVESFVPNNFFIQNYSSRKTETLKTFTENKNIYFDKKKTIMYSPIFIEQSQFTGKYYDYGLLIYKKETGSYILYLFQVSKKKIATNRYYREEHKIIFNRVKENLEKIFSIVIDEGYFSYILVEEEKDEKTIDFCNENSLKYYLFSIHELKFMTKELEFDNKSLITKEFPIHSSFSILPKELFEKDSKGHLININNIKDFEDKINFQKISKKFQGILLQYFKLKNSEISPEKNEFLIVGNYDKIFDVNHSFCIWVDNDDALLIFTEKNKNVRKIKLENHEKLSDKNRYTLLCSKYKIKYIYDEN